MGGRGKEIGRKMSLRRRRGNVSAEEARLNAETTGEGSHRAARKDPARRGQREPTA